MILLFGGSGQLGCELKNMADRAGVPLAALRREQVDITDRQAVASAIKKNAAELVVNAAAYTKVDQAEDDSESAFRVNATGAGIVAEICADSNLPLIHISTDYVFDGAKKGAYREDDPMAPLGIYGQSKAQGELAVRRLNAKRLILRTAWLYGAYGQNFLKTMLRLATERDELRIVGDQRGSPTSTTDLAEAILRIWRDLSSARWGTYHFAGDGETTWYGFACRIIEAQANFTGKRPIVTAITSADFPSKARRPKNSALDSSYFAATFGFRARPWEQAVEQTIAELLTRS